MPIQAYVTELSIAAIVSMRQLWSGILWGGSKKGLTLGVFGSRECPFLAPSHKKNIPRTRLGFLGGWGSLPRLWRKGGGRFFLHGSMCSQKTLRLLDCQSSSIEASHRSRPNQHRWR